MGENQEDGFGVFLIMGTSNISYLKWAFCEPTSSFKFDALIYDALAGDLVCLPSFQFPVFIVSNLWNSSIINRR